ncbi:MAG: hypothetical protein AAFX80_19795 [Cyanobacteria bacterium J06639_18]
MLLQNKQTLWCAGGGFEEALVDVKVYISNPDSILVVMQDSEQSPENYVDCGTIIDEVIAKIAFIYELNPKTTRWVHVRQSPHHNYVREVIADSWEKVPSSQFSNVKIKQIATPQAIFWIKSNLLDRFEII